MRDAASAELVAIASRSADRAADFAARHGAARAYGSAEELAADVGVDVVYVATEVGRHCDDVLAAARRGKDVLVEKPIARDAAEAARMVDGCRAAGVRLGTCYYKRFNTRHRRMRDLIADGAIGTRVRRRRRLLRSGPGFSPGAGVAIRRCRAAGPSSTAAATSWTCCGSSCRPRWSR